MSRSVVLVLAVLVTAVLGVPPASSASDMDCGDFATQAAAQAFSAAAGAGDPHQLDSDGDGVACESNPCPCTSSPVPLVGTETTESGEAGAVARRQTAVVVSVTDGDTVKVRLDDGAEEYVRIIGIDTPEVHGRRECGGADASRAMRRLAPVGSRVRLVPDRTQADRDRYDRLLRYVERRGKDVGKAQVAAGLAHVYVYRNDPFRRTGVYRLAERRARALDRGLWSRCWR